MTWFEVDRGGLAQVLGRQEPARAIAELISNAWDEQGVTEVRVEIQAIQGKPQVRIAVTDDAPNGFANLAESYVLFAASKKKVDVETRGRFNVGEKLFLARCIEAEITSTTGRVFFCADGKRVRSKTRLSRGTELRALMPMTRDELTEAAEALSLLIPPRHIRTTIWIYRGPDDETTLDLSARWLAPIAIFRARLQTELADAEGALRPSERETDVEVYRSADVGSRLYEMGIPVVEIEGPFSVNVMQKVPLTIDRENVKPAFLRRLGVALLDRTHALLKGDEAKAEWVTEAMAQAAPDTVSNLMDQRFGKKRVSYDPSDQEANKRAASEGYTVVPGGSLPATVWANVRTAGAIKPAGQVTPTKRPEFSLDGEDVAIPYAEWTDAMDLTVKHLEIVARFLLGDRTGFSTPTIVRRLQPGNFAACYSQGGFLILNLQRLGHDWFNRGAAGLQVDHVDLLVHELGHEWCSDHLASEYHDALTRLAGKLALGVANDPKLRRTLHREEAA